ncbi:hypothetical protein SAMN05421644_11521 [Allochromatium warmingii]|uniref:Uncharacterized protein n=1 Tax=Allochromatium warmingii TaxID=61595 RepID=A0A1H3EZK8_ALLWA|nr:hypothetical protein [Allochromatium warmingii]SDX83334.1 hypothetical protein SAMN05421644_11521 [Allochromatium warmingii]
MNWKKLKAALHEIYSQENIENDFEKDEKYLKSAFDFTEKYWDEQIKNIGSIKILLFSEAPLFGDEKAYIYNPDYGFTAFFYFNDLNAIFSKNMQNDFSTKTEKKIYFIKKLNEAGILILDIFPFAFNPKITTGINYQTMSTRLYSKIFETTMEHFLSIKLSSIKPKITDKTIFAVRYKKLLTKTGHLIKTALEKIGIKNSSIISLNGSNMSMNRNYLSKLYSEIN